MASKLIYSLNYTHVTILTTDNDEKQKYSKTIFKLNYSEYEFNNMINVLLPRIKFSISTFINLKSLAQSLIDITIMDKLKEFNKFSIIVEYIEDMKIKKHKYIIKINSNEYNIKKVANMLKYSEKNIVKGIKEILNNLMEKEHIKNKIEIEDISLDGDMFWLYRITHKNR